MVLAAFDPKSSKNVVVYWGQSANPPIPLRKFCDDDVVDVINLSFMNNFGNSPMGINFAGSCWDPTCPAIASDITYCQGKGKIVLLALGGAIGNYGFNNARQATTFATQLWNATAEGRGKYRPFGKAIVDGWNLDIENYKPLYYDVFLKALKKLMDGSKLKRTYYISAAPQCWFPGGVPDESLHVALDTGLVSLIFIQFYNNPSCEVFPKGEGSSFNFDVWDNWRAKKSVNSKLYIGLPGDSASAGSGFTTNIAGAYDLGKKFSSFGGFMFWDAQTAQNSGLSKTAKNVMNGRQAALTVSPSLTNNGKPDTFSNHTTPHPSGHGNLFTEANATQSIPIKSGAPVQKRSLSSRLFRK